MHALRMALCLFVLAAPQLAPAVQHAEPGMPAHAGLPEPDLVERGGTIDGVDATRHTILVDGAPYAVVPGALRIHLSAGRTTSSLADLRRGMQIRFTSPKDRRAQVRELWVTGTRKR